MQTALITGGTRGFELALATSLVRDGWSVVVDGRDRHVLDAALAALQAASRGQVVRGISGDVEDPAHRAALVAAVKANSANLTFWSTTPARWAVASTEAGRLSARRFRARLRSQRRRATGIDRGDATISAPQPRRGSRHHV